MRCEDALKYLSPYLDSELDPKTSFDIARHLEQCETCRRRFEAEKQFEAQIVERLSAPAPGDDAAWAKALSSLPKRRRWPYALAATAAAIIAVLWVLRPQHDLLDELKHDYDKLASGRSVLDVPSSDAAEVERFFNEKMGLAVRPPIAARMTLVGGRKCSLRGTPTAFMAYRCKDQWISIAVFDRANLDRFPKDRAMVENGTFQDVVGGISIAAKPCGWKVICVAGPLPLIELEEILSQLK
jgi:anti-sigma factor RsiW